MIMDRRIPEVAESGFKPVSSVLHTFFKKKENLYAITAVVA